MITLFVEENNTITPNFYNNLISNLQFHKLHCSCGHSGCLSVHGYYYRYLMTPSGKLRFRICRVICEVCGKTHAILLSSFVPYSQISLKDHVEVIDAYENIRPTASLLKSNDSVQEGNFRYIILQYRKFWRQKLLSERISLHPLTKLVQNCFGCFSFQFMQIRRTTNHLFLYTT